MVWAHLYDSRTSHHPYHILLPPIVNSESVSGMRGLFNRLVVTGGPSFDRGDWTEGACSLYITHTTDYYLILLPCIIIYFITYYLIVHSHRVDYLTD